jgi:hypothetical protein
MPRTTDTTLLGQYATPAFAYGDVAFCALRGEVTLVGLREAPIPWPVGKKQGQRVKALVLYAGLAEAVRRESAAAIMHWWRVGSDKVWKWRRALGVSPTTEGTSRLRTERPPAPDARRGAADVVQPPSRRQDRGGEEGRGPAA